MWTGKISLEGLKEIVGDSIMDLDFRDFWMITWIDKVGLSDDGTPYVKASVHRVKATDLRNFKVEGLDLKRPQWISLPLRLLRIFPVGTLFGNGMAMFRTHYSYLPSFTIDLNTALVFERTTLGKWQHGTSLINAMSWKTLDTGYPKSEDKRFAANSNILIYPNVRRKGANYDYIVFPTTELARFYWFSSTRLFRALMDGKASSDLKNELYVPESAVKKSQDGKEFHEILVRDTMHLRDVEFIARLAFSPDALRSANTIYKSVINAKLESGNKGSAHLDCIFPFNSDTTLKVKGYTIKIDSITVLMVTELRQCHGPWPFERLAYDRETPQSVVDESLEKKGTKAVASEGTEEPTNDEDDDPEDNFEGFILNKDPYLKGNPGFDHFRKNNNQTNSVEYTDKGSRFPTMPRDKKRLDRKRIVPPKNFRPRNSIQIDNISVNENTQSGGNSTNVDLVSKEKGLKIKKINLSEYVVKLCEYFRVIGGQADFVCLIDEEDPESKRWYQRERTSMTIPITDESIFLYMIYVRLKGHEFIVCWMDPELGTSLKIVTKYKLNDDESISFLGPDIGIIVEAIRDNYKVMGQLSENEKSGFEVSRLYNTEDTKVEEYCERILAKVKIKSYSDD